MNKVEFLTILGNGESSGVEFKRDDVENHDLAKELVALLNLQGGVVLLGVEDDGTIRGVTRERLEEWVAELCRRKIEPPIIPFLEWVRDAQPGKNVLVVRVPVGPDKPYARIHNDRRTYFIRVGSTNREASREELERMFQASGRVQYGQKPVPGSTLDDLDGRRLTEYFGRVLGGQAPPEEDVRAWERLLRSVEFMTESTEVVTTTVDGMLLFGRSPNRFLAQSGIRALAYRGDDPEYAALDDQELRGPMVLLRARDGSMVEAGLVEQSLAFVRRNTGASALLEAGTRVDRPDYPQDVLREVIVNALVHRDYSIIGTDITLTIYGNRLEVQSPGRLPNTVTIDAMRAGYRYARNQTLVNVMRDYRYVEFRGMGIREKIIPGMLAHNDTEPEFIEDHDRFIVRLWKERQLE